MTIRRRRIITTNDIGAGLGIVDDKLVVTGGANGGANGGGVTPVKVTLPFGNGEPYDINYDYSNDVDSIDRVVVSVLTNPNDTPDPWGRFGSFEYFGADYQNGHDFSYSINRTAKTVSVPLQHSNTLSSGSGYVNIWLFPKSPEGAGVVETVEDEVVYQSPASGDVIIFKKYSNIPDYVQTNVATLDEVRDIDGVDIFMLNWALPDERNGYNSSTGKLVIVP